MTATPDQRSEPSIPVSALVEWLNGHAAQTDKDATTVEIAEILGDAEPATVEQKAQLERLLGSVAGRQTLLIDLQGLLVAHPEIAAGEVDDISTLDTSPEA